VRVLELGAFGVAGVLALNAVRGGRKLPASPAALVFAAAALWGVAQIVFHRTVYPHDTWNRALYFGVLGAIALIARHAAANSAARRYLLDAFLWMSLIVAGAGVTGAYLAPGRIFGLFASGYVEVWGTFPNRNHFAMLAELAIPVALWRGLAGRPDYLVIAAVLGAAAIAAASRGGAVLIGGEFAALIVLARPRVFKRAALALVLLIVLSAIAGGERLAARFTEADPVRGPILQSTLAMIGEAPWTGFGLGTFATVYPAFARFDAGRVVNQAHNDWAEFAAEGGIPFAMLMLGFAGWIVRLSIRSGWGIGVAAVFLHASVDYPFARAGIAVWLVVLIALIEGSAERSRTRGALST
jgi:O-antigen ligase